MDETTTHTTQITGPDAAAEAAAGPTEVNPPDPETERLRAENNELRNTIRMRDARDRIGQLLTAADARSPELLLAAVTDEMQFDEAGGLENAAALVERLKRTFPEQFGMSRTHGSADAAVGSRSAMQVLTADSLARMTPAQIQKLDWAEVRRVLST